MALRKLIYFNKQDICFFKTVGSYCNKVYTFINNPCNRTVYCFKKSLVLTQSTQITDVTVH